MASSSVCWGLELGSGSVKAMKIEVKGDRPVVTDFLVVPHAKVLTTPGIDQDDAMRVALGTLATQRDLSGARVAVGVPGDSSFARFAKLPPVEAKKIPDIVKFEAAQQIPFPLEDVEWDYQTFQSPDSPDVEAGIFAMTKDRLKRQLDLLADVGISPEVVTLNPVAVYNGMAYDLEFSEATAGTILLDIGTRSTDLVIAEAGTVWIRTFAIGGDNFTKAVAEAFSLSYAKADRLKREAQQTRHAKHVFQAMRGVFGDLAQEVQRSIGYYQSLHEKTDLKRLIGMGATFNLPGLRKFLKQQIQMDVYRLERFKRAGVGDKGREEEMEAHAGELAVCFGLALQGVGFETIDANLIPVDIVRASMWRRKTPFFVAAAVLAVAGSAMMFYRPYNDSNELKGLRAPEEVARASREVRQARDRAQEAGVLGGGAADMTAANLVTLLDHPTVHAHLLHDVGEMFQSADEKLAATTFAEDEGPVDPPAYELVKLDLRFVPPGTSISGVLPTQREVEDDPNQERQRIAVTLIAKTPHPDPRQFMVETIDKWLRENAQREGVPYTIIVDEQDLLVRIDAAQIAVVDSGGGSGGRGGRGRRGNDRGPHSIDDPFADMQDLPDDVMITGTGAPVRGGRRGQAGDRELNQLAPLDPTEDPREEQLKEIEVFWYVVLGDAGDEGEG